MKKLLLINGFNKQYPDRNISSIYLDTLNYNFAKDNANGVSRRKNWLRWYNDNLDKISYEEKNKENFNVWKKTSKLNFQIDKTKIIESLKNKISNLYNKHNNFNYKFVLKTNYTRSYWISNNKKIRATIDIDINTSPANDLSRNLYLGETILEFELINIKSVQNFLIKKFLLRTNKYSKYVRSFIELNSGLIN